MPAARPSSTCREKAQAAAPPAWPSAVARAAALPQIVELHSSIRARRREVAARLLRVHGDRRAGPGVRGVVLEEALRARVPDAPRRRATEPTHVPSAEKQTPRTALCSKNVAVALAASASQTFTNLSSPPDAATVPSGDQHAARTQFAWLATAPPPPWLARRAGRAPGRR